MKVRERRFTPYFEWCEIQNDGHCRIGITDLAQSKFGQIVYLEFPSIGEKVEKDSPCSFIESQKSVVDILSPLSGVVTDVNYSLLAQPSLINQSPYEKGWLLSIRLDNLQEWNDLLVEMPESMVKEKITNDQR